MKNRRTPTKPKEPPIESIADALVAHLQALGVRHVFGYPGGQLTPIYDALYRTPAIRHILARDEQAAAFMADGYARSSGKVGVCLAVCGPGVYNAATALATSHTDSVPVLLISGQIPKKGLGLRSGNYHENEQLHAAASFTKKQYRAEEPGEVCRTLDKALFETTDGRPGPVLLEIPVDVLRAPRPSPSVSAMTWSVSGPEISLLPLAQLIASWKRPVLLAGGGVLRSRAERSLVKLAEILGAPVFTTANGKGSIPEDHPLAAGLPWHRATSDLSDMSNFFSPLLAQADGLLAIGCRFSQLTTGNWSMPLPPALAQIDIDPPEIGRHYPVTCDVAMDAAEALGHLLVNLPGDSRRPWATLPRAKEPWLLAGLNLAAPLRRQLSRNGILVADVTRLAYILMVDFPVYTPRTFLHPAGSVAMGYGIPAALGAKTAFPERPVVVVVGDGGFNMSAMEIATAVQEKLPIVIVLVNDNCLSLIKATQERKYDKRYIGVDLHNPDFRKFAEAFGVAYWQADSEESFEKALAEALSSKKTALIEVQLAGSPGIG